VLWLGGTRAVPGHTRDVGAMSKRDTITNNILALTHSRSFVKAVDGWFVKKLVTLSRQQQSCELCGTRFREGAVVEHRRSKATVLVGGTCLKTLQAHRFPKRFRFKAAKQHTLTTLRVHYRSYRSLVDAGNWLLWVRENAPPRLVQVASDLCIFGATTDLDQLRKLIRFHDKKRRFPRSALLTDPGALERRLQTRIPNYITIVQAQQFERQGAMTSPKEKLEIAASNYLEDHVLARISEDADLEQVWVQVGPLAQRAVTALAALDERAVRTGNKLLVPDHVAANWATPGEAPMFVWNASIGLGFVSRDDVFASPKANVWLWRSARYQRAIYSLDYWCGITDCEQDAVEQLEKLAFG
jgi:hypothetical protein